MRVGVIELWGTSNSGLYATLFSNGIAANGASVTLYTSNTYQYDRLCNTVVRKVIFHPYGRWRRLKTIRMAFILISYVSVLLRLILDKPDIIHFQPVGFSFIPADIFFYLLAGRCRKNVYITLHNINDPKSNVILNRLLISFLKKSNINTIVHDEMNQRFLMKCGVKRVKVIEHGVYDQYFDSIKKTRWEVDCRSLLRGSFHLKLLIFGSPSEHKGIVEFLTAFSKIEDKRVLVAVIGKSKEQRLKKKIVDISRGQPNIVFIDEYVGDEALSDLFSKFDACVFPYKNTFRSQSGALYLAYTFSTPVIVTDVGGLSWSVNKYGTGCVIDVNPRDISNCISRLAFNKKADLQRFKTSTLTAKKELSWGEIGKKVLDLYSESSI